MEKCLKEALGVVTCGDLYRERAACMHVMTPNTSRWLIKVRTGTGLGELRESRNYLRIIALALELLLSTWPVALLYAITYTKSMYSPVCVICLSRVRNYCRHLSGLAAPIMTSPRSKRRQQGS